MGESPLRYITGWRLTKAAAYLRTGTWKLAEIARLVGYDSEVGLSKAFKRNFGIAPGGRKSEKLGYHIYIGPAGQSLIAGGLYMPTAGQLAKFRQAIDQDAHELKRIAGNKTFIRYFGTIEGEKLMTAPQGFSRTHPEIELLKLKQVVVARHFADTDVVAPDFPDHAVHVCQAMRPFLDYLNRVLQ